MSHRGGVLRIGVTGLDTLDPVDVSPTAIGSMIAIDLLFDGLTAIDTGTGRAISSLAKSFTSNPDLTTWTFVLRDDATFADGSNVTATDVKASLERVARRAGASLAGARLDVIVGYSEFVGGKADQLTGVAAADAHTVVITTAQPFAGLPELLASPLYGIVPKRSVESAKAEFAAKPVGSGPYKLVSGSAAAGAAGATAGSNAGSGGVLRLERAPGSTANADAVEITTFSDEAAAYQAFKDGKVDVVKVPFTQIDAAPGELGKRFSRVANAEQFFAMNPTAPSLGDERYRQAIVHAIDRGKLAKIIGGPGAMDGIVPSGVPGATTNACGDLCKNDVAAAKALVAQAYPNGDQPTVNIDFYHDDADKDSTKAQQLMADSIKADLTAAGIPANEVGHSFEEYRTFALGSSTQLFTYGWVGLAPDPDAYLGPLFLKSSGDPVAGFSRPEVETMIRAARGVSDPAERAKKYGEAEKAALAQAILVPISDYHAVAVGPRVQDFTVRLDGTFAVDRVWVQG